MAENEVLFIQNRDFTYYDLLSLVGNFANLK